MKMPDKRTAGEIHYVRCCSVYITVRITNRVVQFITLSSIHSMLFIASINAPVFIVCFYLWNNLCMM